MVNDVGLSIAACILSGLAIVLTIFRLIFRLKIQRFGWEDMWAAVVLFWGSLFTIVNGIYFETDSYEAMLVSAWISSYTFTSIVWSVRMSLLYSIIRITPSMALHNFMRATGAIFIVVWAILVALKTWWCIDNTNTELGRPGCFLPSSISLFEVTSDFLADTILFSLSLKLLWRVNLPRRQHRMILSLFLSGAVMSFFSLMHAVVQVVRIPSLEYVFTELELAASLIVCNLLVVVTYIYRVLLDKGSGECSPDSDSEDDFTTPIRPRSLTTIILDTADTRSQGTERLVVS